jgi:hypothetical protein
MLEEEARKRVLLAFKSRCGARERVCVTGLFLGAAATRVAISGYLCCCVAP